MGWTGKETCIKCDQGGKVLVCSERGCPLAVHEECMHCSARFDDLGNFYCPYCIFKRAILESCKAKKKAMVAKKALSGFLDKGIIDSEQQKQKAENVNGKEPKLSTVVGENDHFVQIEEDQQVNFGPECTTSILPCKGVEISSVNEQNNVGLLRYEDNAGLDNRDQNEIVVEQQIQPDSIIASGSGGKHFGEEEPGHQFKMVQVAVQAEHQRQVDGKQLEGVVEDEQQAEPLCASPVEEDLDVALHIPTKGKRKSAEILEKNEGRTIEEEEMQPGHQFKIVQAAEMFQAEHQGQADDSQHERVVEDEQQAEPLCASIVEEDLDVTPHIPTKGKWKSAEVLEKNEGRTVEEEEMQPGHQFKMVQAAERFQAEHQRQVVDNQHETVVEDEQQSEPLSGSPVEEDLDVALHVPTKGKRKSAEILEKHEGRTVEEEEMQERVQDTIVSSSGRNPAPQVHAKASHSLSQETSTVSTRWRHVKEKNQSVGHHRQNVATPRRSSGLSQNVATPRKSSRKLSQNVATPRRSSRKLTFEPDATSELNEKNTTTKKPRQFHKPSTWQEKPTFPKVRRKKRPWTEEEEEKLKVGVQKYSTKVNKNLPWRKILEFGCDVFDGTRTPVDLKDKWRNMDKRCSTNQ